MLLRAKIFMLFFLSIHLSATAKSNADSVKRVINFYYENKNFVSLDSLIKKNRHEAPEIARYAAHKMFDIIPSEKEDTLRAKHLVTIAKVLSDVGNYEKALSILDMAEKCYDNNKSILWEIYSVKGNLYRYQFELDKALIYYFKLLKLSEEMNSYEGMAVAYNNIGVIYYYWQRYDNALKYYSKH